MNMRPQPLKGSKFKQLNRFQCLNFYSAIFSNRSINPQMYSPLGAGGCCHKTRLTKSKHHPYSSPNRRFDNMKRPTIFFLWIFLMTSFGMRAQVVDSIPEQSKLFKKVVLDSNFVENLPDTSIINSKKKGRKPQEDRFLYKVFKKDYPNPKTAMLLSFAIPGMGQIYNRRWWKPPVVWGGMGWSIYNIVKNTNQYKIYRDAYIQSLAGETTVFEGQRFNNPNDLKQIRDGYDKNRQLSFVAAILVYGIQGAEAFVDAHLRTFDVSDDLSLNMRVKPAFENNFTGEMTMGIELSFHFEKRVEQPKILILP